MCMQNVNRNFIYEDSKLTQPFGNNICLWMQRKKKKKEPKMTTEALMF